MFSYPSFTPFLFHIFVQLRLTSSPTPDNQIFSAAIHKLSQPATSHRQHSVWCSHEHRFSCYFTLQRHHIPQQCIVFSLFAFIFMFVNVVCCFWFRFVQLLLEFFISVF